MQVWSMRDFRANREVAIKVSVQRLALAAKPASSPPLNHLNRLYSKRRSRRALKITENELKVIAALAIMGLSSRPNHGYPSRCAAHDAERADAEAGDHPRRSLMRRIWRLAGLGH